MHYLVKQQESSMLYKFFITQWKYPAARNEWTEQVKRDLNDFGLSANLEEMKKISSYSFKNQVKIKAREFAFLSFLEMKEKHSKLENLFYRDLKLQSYLNSEDITHIEAQCIYSYRTRMFNYGHNFGNTSPCPLCHNHSDTQKWSFSCNKIRENVEISGQYSNIFSEQIQPATVKTIMQISKYRKEYLDQRAVK